MMRIQWLREIPGEGDAEPLEADLLARLCAGAAECWYCYYTQPYMGTGAMLLRYPDGRWSWLDLGHCSCYAAGEREEPTWYDSELALEGRVMDVYERQILAHVRQEKGSLE